MKNKKSILKILRIACDYYAVDINLINTPTRKAEVVLCRQVAQEISATIYKKTNTLDEIGSLIGGRTSGAVSHAKRTVNNLMITNRQFRVDYNKIKKLVYMEPDIINQSERLLLEMKCDFDALYKRLHKLIITSERK